MKPKFVVNGKEVTEEEFTFFLNQHGGSILQWDCSFTSPWYYFWQWPKKVYHYLSLRKAIREWNKSVKNE